MFGTYFYNKNIRNIVILFGTVFNDIIVRRTTSTGVIQEEFKVPIAYGPSEKFLVRLRQATDISKGKVGLTLPRMSFEFTAINYDPTRKLQSTKKIKSPKGGGLIESVTVTNPGNSYTSAPTVTISGGGGTGATAVATIDSTTKKITNIQIATPGSGYTGIPTVSVSGGGGRDGAGEANIDASTTLMSTVYNPVPYNFDFTLSIMVKNSDDGTQILEQILPYFTPEYQVTLHELSALGIKRDIPIIFTGLSTEDSYEGDYLTRRALIHTLTFTVQAFMYGPSGDVNIIRSVDVNKFDVLTTGSSKVTTTNVKPDPLTADTDDDYGFTTIITDS